MTKHAALSYVATKLALNTAEHRKTAQVVPNLTENTRLVETLNAEAAKALGCASEYEASLSILNA